MDLTNISTIKSLMTAARFSPNKRMGQNFLIDKGALEKIVEVAEINQDDIVLEIGPGLGVLTRELCQRAKKVVAVEMDSNLAGILKATTSEHDNLEIINDDFLDFNLSEKNEFDQPFKVVSNLPYQISSPTIRKLLGNSKAESLVFLIQKEVAERICAKPGDSNRGYLTVLVEFFADAKIIAKVSKGSFWPSPAVESAIIKFNVKKSKPNVEEKEFFKLVQAGFSQKRKQLLNTLSNGLKISKPDVNKLLDQVGVDPTRRAETLSLEEWLGIYNILEKK